jgi:hypothetical protein
VDFERMDEFEQELHQALERRPAPPLLKQRILAERNRRMREQRGWMPHMTLWMRVAASLLIVALLGGGAEWGIRRSEERQRGEEARRQVMIALRITGRELNQVRTRLATHDRAQER